jgi:hypothetical protein
MLRYRQWRVGCKTRLSGCIKQELTDSAATIVRIFHTGSELDEVFSWVEDPEKANAPVSRAWTRASQVA